MCHTEDGKGKMCRCPHHMVISVFVLLFGILFLVHAFGMLSDYFVSVAWPILVIAAGLHKMMSGMCKCCSGSMTEDSHATTEKCCKDEHSADTK